jgi:hypothetical protein
MVDQALQAAHKRAIARAGQAVTFLRLSGVEPNVTTISAAATAVVRDYLPDRQVQTQEGYGSGDVGGITQGERQILVMSADLAAAGWPLNGAGFAVLQKGDKVTVMMTGEELQVTRVDPGKRYLAGCLEAYAVGV